MVVINTQSASLLSGTEPINKPCPQCGAALSGGKDHQKTRDHALLQSESCDHKEVIELVEEAQPV